MIKAVIFDLDGVIINSEPLKARAHVAVFEDRKFNLTSDAYKFVLGQSSRAVFNYFSEISSIDIGFTEYRKQFLDKYNDLLRRGDCSFTKGFPEFFASLVENECVLGLVTSTSRSSIEKLSILDPYIPQFNCIVCEEDVSEHKPSPEPYKKALDILDISSGDVLVFEDTKVGIDSAKAAGTEVIGIKHSMATFQDYSGVVEVWNNFNLKSWSDINVY